MSVCCGRRVFAVSVRCGQRVFAVSVRCDLRVFAVSVRCGRQVFAVSVRYGRRVFAVSVRCDPSAARKAARGGFGFRSRDLPSLSLKFRWAPGGSQCSSVFSPPRMVLWQLSCLLRPMQHFACLASALYLNSITRFTSHYYAKAFRIVNVTSKNNFPSDSNPLRAT